MPSKSLSSDEILQTEQDLQSKQSAKRRSAAKKIGKYQLTQLGDVLYKAYVNELKDKRTWETQTEMIIALGKIKYKNALQNLNIIIKKNEPHDMITIAAARSYVRVKRRSLDDSEPVIDLIKEGQFSVLSGAIGVLAYDDMLLSEKEIEKIISILDNKNENELAISGYADPRVFLISAMSKWDKKSCEIYLKRFLNSNNAMLRISAEVALKGKKTQFE